MAKKHWIYIKRGLSESPKHRDAMGNRIWLFMHIIDRADWETGIVHEWKDKDEAEDMGIPQRTLQQQRQELQELGYISSQSKGHYLRITIHKWINPKDYSGKVLNLHDESTVNSVVSDENESTVQSTENTVLAENESTVQSTVQTTVESTVQPFRDLRTPSSNSKIIDHRSMDEWMKDDPICKFLKTLPGFNITLLESTRREIIAHHYEQGELPYLWNECALADNPIGLFTYKVTNGQHSIDWQMLQMQQSKETDRKVRNEVQLERTEAELERRRATRHEAPAKDDPDPYAPTDEYMQLWHLIVSELSFDVHPNTRRAYIDPAHPVSVNGNWTIAVPSVEWWRSLMYPSLKRVYKKLTGEVTDFIFVELTR